LITSRLLTIIAYKYQPLSLSLNPTSSPTVSADLSLTHSNLIINNLHQRPLPSNQPATMKLAATILTTLIAIAAAAPPALNPTDVSNPGPTARSVAANESPDVSTPHAYNMIMSFVSLLTQTKWDATLELLVQLKLVTQEQVDSLHIDAYAGLDACAQPDAYAQLLVQLKLVTEEQVDSLHIGAYDGVEAYAEVDARAAAPAPAAPTDTGGK
jgi:hypothetical protein